jgi:hypothetical protein
VKRLPGTGPAASRWMEKMSEAVHKTSAMNGSNGSAGQLASGLAVPPRILCDRRKRLVLMWSAKAGCTFAVKWFFNQIDLLHAADYYHPWVHKFREDVFYASEQYQRALRDFSLHRDQYTVIKIVRNPFDRTVSAYLHVLEWLHFNNPVVRPIRFYLKLRKPLRNSNRLSFREFVGFLESLNGIKGDIHFKPQYHYLEAEKLLAPDRIVKLEDSHAALRRIERDLDLKPTEEFKRFRSSYHNTKREPDHGFCGRQPLGFVSSKNYPASKSFYDDELRQRVLTVFKDDFTAYGYDTDY